MKLPIIIALFLLVLPFVQADTAQLGEGCGGGEFYVACTTDCYWTCDSEGNRVQYCNKAHGWCFNDDGSCYACDFIDKTVPTDDTCSVQQCSGLDSSVGGTQSCIDTDGDGTEDDLYEIRKTYECSQGTCEGTNNFVQVEHDSAVCIQEGSGCIEKRWVLDVDGDGYHSLEWSADILGTPFPGVVIQDELCGPPTSIPEAVGLTSMEQGQFRSALTAACGTHAGCTEPTSWIPRSASSGLEVGCDDNTFADSGSVCRAQDDPSSPAPETSTAALDTPQTLFCFDNDNDGHGGECDRREDLTQTEANNRFASYELVGTFDCNDNSALQHPFTAWVKDSDDDGYWGEVQVQCNDPDGLVGNDWEIRATFPSDELIDCDDRDNTKENIFSQGKEISGECSCLSSQEGYAHSTPSGTFFCKDAQQNQSTIYGGTVAFAISAEEQYQWYFAEPGQDFENNVVTCPADTCPYGVGTTKRCVEPNTFWNDDGVGGTTGMRLCVLEENGDATWSTRAAKVGAMLTSVGETTGKDFSVYCDDAYAFVQSLASDTTEVGNMDVYLQDLMLNELGSLKSGCVLTINEPYSAQIEGGQVHANAQKIIVGLPVSGNVADRDTLFGVDVSLETWNQDWVTDGDFYLYKPLKLLFVVEEGSQEATDFITTFNTNGMVHNFLGFLRNPLTHLTQTYAAQNTAPFEPHLLSDFERSYLGRQENTYWFSTEENGEITTHIQNPDENLKTYFENACFSPVQEINGVPIDCLGIEGGAGTNLADSFGVHFASTSEQLWQTMSRQLRMQANTVPITTNDFYETECSTDPVASDYYETVCPSPAIGFNAACTNGFCDYVEKGIVDGDGYCPAGLYKAEDDDCEEKPGTIISLRSVVRSTACLPDEISLLSLEETNPALGAISPTFVNARNVCLSVEEGRLIRNTGGIGACNAGEAVVALSEQANGGTFFSPTRENLEETRFICLEHEQDDGSPGFAIDCTVASYSPGDTEIISLTDVADARAGEAGVFEQGVYCRLFDGSPAPRAGTCGNERDDDGDGFVDQYDQSCLDEDGNYDESMDEIDQPLDAVLANACSSVDEEVLALSGTENAHAEEIGGTYPLKLCINGAYTTEVVSASIGCSAGYSPMIGLASATNAHVYDPATTPASGNLICIRGPGGPQECIVDEACFGYEEVVGVSSGYNAHAGAVGTYEQNLCCKPTG